MTCVVLRICDFLELLIIVLLFQVSYYLMPGSTRSNEAIMHNPHTIQHERNTINAAGGFLDGLQGTQAPVVNAAAGYSTDEVGVGGASSEMDSEVGEGVSWIGRWFVDTYVCFIYRVDSIPYPV